MMIHRDPNRLADRIVFWICLTLAFIFYSRAMYDFAYERGLSVPRKCATVAGQQVVSSTAETCTYAAVYGRATTKRRAM